MKQAAVILVFGPGNNVLGIRRSGTDPWQPLKWNFPGGGIEPGESVVQGALRELREETGLVAHRQELKYLFSYRGYVLVHVLGLNVSHLYIPSFDDREHDQYAWRPLTQLPRPRARGVKALIQLYTTRTGGTVCAF
jgi:8-oxo-dGTP pyrophosphatase MutT (NUDIX family)